MAKKLQKTAIAKKQQKTANAKKLQLSKKCKKLQESEWENWAFEGWAARTSSCQTEPQSGGKVSKSDGFYLSFLSDSIYPGPGGFLRDDTKISLSFFLLLTGGKAKKWNKSEFCGATLSSHWHWSDSFSAPDLTLQQAPCPQIPRHKLALLVLLFSLCVTQPWDAGQFRTFLQLHLALR